MNGKAVSFDFVITGVGSSHGTFGELLQGALAGPDQDFLVTLPIARWSTAQLTLTTEAETLTVRPAEKRKSLEIATVLLGALDHRRGGQLTVSSTLPEGKGMASSSADLVATVRAVANAVGVPFTPASIETLLRAIEPTDGLMYPDSVAFYHRQVRLCRRLGRLPAMTIVGIDEGGTVDTVDFNAGRSPIPAAQRPEYQRLLESLDAAIAAGDPAGIARVATRSAVLNQSRCEKKHLDRVLEISTEVGALGVVAAHSGTMLGLLLADTDPDYPGKLAELAVAGEELGTVSIDHTLG